MARESLNKERLVQKALLVFSQLDKPKKLLFLKQVDRLCAANHKGRGIN